MTNKYIIKATGLSKSNYSRFVNRISVGTTLYLKRDIDNVYDRYATGIYIKDILGELQQIGWVPKSENQNFLKALGTNNLINGINTISAEVKVHNTDKSALWNSELVLVVYLNTCPAIYAANTDHLDATAYTTSATLTTATTGTKFYINTPNKQEPIMDKIINVNKHAASAAAYNEAARIALNQLTKVAAKNAPLMVRGYLDTPFGKLVLANLAVAAVQQFRPNDTKLNKLASAAVSQAYQEVYQTFDIEKIINEFVDNASIKEVLNNNEFSDLN